MEKSMKFKLGAVIPVVNYGNLQPEIEVEAETFEEAYNQAMPHIQKLWNDYVDKGKNLGSGDRKKLKAFIGGEIYYDEATHTYTNEAGEVYLSGSVYAQQFEKPFDAKAISATMGQKYGVDAEQIIEMWELKARASREFGTALHSALELYGRFNGLSTALERENALHDHPVLKKAVRSFYEAHKDYAEYEVLVVDHMNKRAGRIDRLNVTSSLKGHCRIQDFKTNADITKHLDVYWKQLLFYGEIMEAGGWTVEGYDIFWWDGEWHEYHKEKELSNDTSKDKHLPAASPARRQRPVSKTQGRRKSPSKNSQ